MIFSRSAVSVANPHSHCMIAVRCFSGRSSTAASSSSRFATPRAAAHSTAPSRFATVAMPKVATQPPPPGAPGGRRAAAATTTALRPGDVRAPPATATTTTAATSSTAVNNQEQPQPQTRWEYLCDSIGGLATWQLAVDQGFAWTFYYLLSCGVVTAAGLHAWCEQTVPFLGMDFDSPAAKWGADYYWWGAVRPKPVSNTRDAASAPATSGVVDVFDSYGNTTSSPLDSCYVSEQTLDRYSAAHKLAMLALPLQVAVVWGSYPTVFRVWSRTSVGRKCNAWAASMQQKLDNQQRQVKARKLF